MRQFGVLLSAGDTLTLFNRNSETQILCSAPIGLPALGSSVRVLRIQ